MKNFTIADIKTSKVAGLNPHIFTKRDKNYSEKRLKNIPRPSPQKDWLELNLQSWCNKHSLELVTELKFAPDRKWRFDWAIPALMVAVEYEGIFSTKSRHTTNSGFTADTDKYNRAQQLGWRVIRFTANNYKNLVNELNGYL